MPKALSPINNSHSQRRNTIFAHPGTEYYALTNFYVYLILFVRFERDLRCLDLNKYAKQLSAQNSNH
jgi:hypothetical protein